jgi:hypothetical protein
MGTKKFIKQLNNVVYGNKSNYNKKKDTKDTKQNKKQPDNKVYKGDN